MSKLDGTLITSSCSKCKGLLVPDAVPCETGYWLYGVRCINCGASKLNEKIQTYVNQTKDRRTNKPDELELYRTRSGRTKRGSYNIQH